MGTKPPTRPKPEYFEGLEAYQRFDSMMTALVAVPHSVIEKREKAYRKKVETNPNRRGPKRKNDQPKKGKSPETACTTKHRRTLSALHLLGNQTTPLLPRFRSPLPHPYKMAHPASHDKMRFT
jgi:hypothetical protein